MEYEFQEYPKWIDGPEGKILVDDAEQEAEWVALMTDDPKKKK